MKKIREYLDGDVIPNVAKYLGSHSRLAFDGMGCNSKVERTFHCFLIEESQYREVVSDLDHAFAVADFDRTATFSDWWNSRCLVVDWKKMKDFIIQREQSAYKRGREERKK